MKKCLINRMAFPRFSYNNKDCTEGIIDQLDIVILNTGLKFQDGTFCKLCKDEDGNIVSIELDRIKMLALEYHIKKIDYYSSVYETSKGLSGEYEIANSCIMMNRLKLQLGINAIIDVKMEGE